MSLQATNPIRNTAIENQRANLAKMEFPGRAGGVAGGGGQKGGGQIHKELLFTESPPTHTPPHHIHIITEEHSTVNRARRGRGKEGVGAGGVFERVLHFSLSSSSLTLLPI